MKKTKLIVLSDISYPDTNAGASRIYERLKYWAPTCDVHLVTQHAANGKRASEVESEIGFKVTRFCRSPFKNKSLFGRAFSYIWFSFLSVFYLPFVAHKGDVLFATSPQFLNLIVAYIVSSIKRTKLVLEISDLWPDILLELGVLSKNSMIYKLWVKCEVFLYRRADVIIALTPGVKRRILLKGVDESKVFSVINGFDEDLWKEKKVSSLTNKFIVGYYGTLGRVIDVELYLKVVKAYWAEHPGAPVEFHLAGQGVKEARILEFINENKELPIKFLGELPKEQMPAVWSLTDVCFIPLVNLEIMKSCIPAKLLECVGVGVPVLLSGPENSDGAKIIRDYGFGHAVNKDLEAKLVKFINDWSQNSNQYQNVLKAMKEHRHLFTRRKQAHEVLAKIQSL